MGVKWEDIDRLAPEEQIKALQGLIENLDKEIEAKQKDKDTAEAMLTRAQELAFEFEEQQVKEETIEEAAQEQKEEAEEDLEQKLRGAPQIKTEEQPQTIEQVYNTLSTIYQREKQTGIETPQDRTKVYNLQKKLEEKRREIKEGTYMADREKLRMLENAEKMADTMYKSTQETYQK